MHISEFLRTVWESLLPFKHKSLAQRPFSFVCSYFFLLIIFSILVMALLLIPTIITLQTSVGEKLDQFDRFGITLDIASSQPVVLVDHPRIVLDLNATKVGGEDVLITDDTLFYRPYPLLAPQTINLSAYEDLKTHTPDAERGALLLFMLVLPSLLILLFFFSAVKFAVLALAASSIGFVITRVRLASISYFGVLKTAVYSLTVAAVFDIILLPYLSLWWLSLGAYLLFFIVSLLAASEGSLTNVSSKHLFTKGSTSVKKTKKGNDDDT